jgi:hypothetical protein
MRIKQNSFLLRFHWIMSAQLGIDIRRFFYFFRGLPRYLLDFIRFRSGYNGELAFVPCLHDWYEEGGATKNEYFWQDFLVARMICAANPEKHVDIGSRVDGFITHVASFREIEVFDIRPMTTRIPNVLFRQADLMRSCELVDYCDSLSCLHALEHFGLGRYGDPIDPQGAERGFTNMARMLKENGVFYLSVPVGMARVEFNANQVFDPLHIIKMAEENALQPLGLTVILGGQGYEEVELAEETFLDLSRRRYALGLFSFVKKTR